MTEEIKNNARIHIGAVVEKLRIDGCELYEIDRIVEDILNYITVPEDSVVLTREEREEINEVLRGALQRAEKWEKLCGIKIKETRKSTAIELSEKVKTKIKELRQKYHEDYVNGLGDEEYNGLSGNNVDEILKEMGVDNG